ncbi:transmembrane protein [Cystoisospora suis]|uniref:Transmembrane protein n=1 Tax=Cystoisospora suis TaxID=483139 RepID=A0A2C6KXN6_9APIC|nr:transmembrane protein [Cystoisospora suis]
MFSSPSSAATRNLLRLVILCFGYVLLGSELRRTPLSDPGKTFRSRTTTNVSETGFFGLLPVVTAHQQAEETGTEENDSLLKRPQDLGLAEHGPPTPGSSLSSISEAERSRWEGVPPNIPVHEAEQAVAALRSQRIEALKEYQKQRQQWLVSRMVSGVTGGPSPSPQEMSFRGKRQRHRRNALVQLLSDHDVDQLQEASITYEPVSPPIQQYMDMINNVRQDRLNVQVEPAVAALPHPSIAYTPFHKEMAKQKSLEKKFRVHYLTGEGKKFPYFHNPEDDCYWKTHSDGTVSCVPMYDLTDKPRHDPAITVAIDQTGMFDTLEEAEPPTTLECADFYLEKRTWTYYCIPAFDDLRPEDYKRMQRYKEKVNAYNYYHWSVQKSQELVIPELNRPPRPDRDPSAASKKHKHDSAAAKKKEQEKECVCVANLQAKKALLQETVTYLRGNRPEAEATIPVTGVQYPLQEGAIIVRPSGYSVEEAPVLTVEEQALLASVSKRFAAYSATSAMERMRLDALGPLV